MFVKENLIEIEFFAIITFRIKNEIVKNVQ